MKKMMFTVAVSTITLACGCKNDHEKPINTDQSDQSVLKDHVFSTIYNEFSTNPVYRNIILITNNEMFQIKQLSELRSVFGAFDKVREVKDIYEMTEIDFFGEFRAVNRFSGNKLDFIFFGSFDDVSKQTRVEWLIVEPIVWEYWDVD